MTRHILKCTVCNNYTMNKLCKCGGTSITTKPAKFSIEDKYAKYRRKAKRIRGIIWVLGK